MATKTAKAAETKTYRLRDKDERGMKIGSPHFERKQVGVEAEPHPVTGMPIPIFEEIETLPGETLESSRDLKSLFPGRFDLLEETEEGQAAALADKDAEIAELKARLAQLEPQPARPEVLGSVECPEALAQSRGPTPEEIKRAKESEESDEEEDDDDEEVMEGHEKKPKAKKDKRGTDVTADFEGASEANMTVFEKKHGKKVKYDVYGPDDAKKPIAKHLTKAQVGATIKDLG